MPALVFVIALAGLFSPLVSAAAMQQFSGTASFPDARFTGSQAIEAGVHAFHAVGNVSSSKANFMFIAERAVVNVTSIDKAEAGPTTGDPSSRVVSVATGPRQYSERTFVGAHGNSTVLSEAGSFLAYAAHSTMSVSGASISPSRMMTSARETWHAGFATPNAVTNGNAVVNETTVPAGLVQLTGSLSAVDLHGNFTVAFWGAAIGISHNGTRTDYRSGQWTLQDTPASGRQERYQLVRITFTNSELSFRASSYATRLVATGAAIEVGGQVDIERATGSFRNPTTRISLAGTPLHVNGAFLVLAEPGPDDSLVARFEGPGAALDAPLANVESLDRRGWRLGFGEFWSRAPLGAWALALFLPLGLVAIAIRSRLTGTIDDAEKALLQDRPKRAVRIAGRLVKRDPSDRDVLFVYGAGLFQAGAVERLTKELNPLARKIPRPDRQGLAFMLALAHAHLKEYDAAEAWAREVNDVPEYRRKIASAMRGEDPGPAQVPGYA